MAIKTSGTVSFDDIIAEFGQAGAPYALSEYYRGGGRVPATRDTYVREPATGEYDPNSTSLKYMWIVNSSVHWKGVIVANAGGGTSVSAGGWTYYRGSHAFGNTYRVYRTKGSTAPINTGVPTSGAISFSQFYGATKT